MLDGLLIGSLCFGLVAVLLAVARPPNEGLQARDTLKPLFLRYGGTKSGRL